MGPHVYNADLARDRVSDGHQREMNAVDAAWVLRQADQMKRDAVAKAKLKALERFA